MSGDEGLVLNLSTGGSQFGSEKKSHSTKKQRLSQKRKERQETEALLEKLKEKRPSTSTEKNESNRSPKKSHGTEKSDKQTKKRKRDDAIEHNDNHGGPSGSGDGEVVKRLKSALFYNNPEIPKLDNKHVEQINEDVFRGDLFGELGIHPFMVKNLVEKLHMKEATAVQKSTIPHILAGKDVLVKSQTGSGKTLAYAIPIVQVLQAMRPKISRTDGIMALVVVPTRELALQTLDVFQKLVYNFTWVVPGCLMGGEQRKREKARLRKGINIVVSTPGRLMDHIENTVNVSLAKVMWLVIDEADRLMEMGFEKDVGRIVTALKEKGHESRKTTLLSATLNAGVERLAGMSLQSPVKVDMTDAAESSVNESTMDKIATPENLKHHCVIVPSKLRLVTLAAFLLWKCKMAAKKSKVLVFMSSQDAVDFHHKLFQRCLLELEDDQQLLYRLHGDMKQKDRTEIFKSFSRADTGVLFCTDVAARGLDLPQVKWIIQYMPPASSTDYVHRVGRTARIGTKGNALLFLTPAEADYTQLLTSCNVNLIEVHMNDILKTLLLEKDKLDSLWEDNQPPYTVEEACSAVQAKFINYVRLDRDARTLARKAYQSFIGAYTAYPSSVKHIFHVKKLHFGHVATSFGLTDAPTRIGNIVGTQSKLNDKPQGKNPRRPGALPSSMHRTNTSEFSSGLSTKLANTAKFTKKEQRKMNRGK